MNSTMCISSPVSSQFTVRSVVSYVVEVRLETVHESVLCLSHILHPTLFAGNAIY